jgi:hypothetical protein
LRKDREAEKMSNEANQQVKPKNNSLQPVASLGFSIGVQIQRWKNEVRAVEWFINSEGVELYYLTSAAAVCT